MITTYLMGLLLICVSENDGKSPTIQTEIVTKWEYKQVSLGAATAPEKLQTQLDLLGDQGWELSVVVARRSENAPDTLLFKRPKVSNEVDFVFQDELGLITIRGNKNMVERTVKALDEIKKRATPSK